MLKKIEDNFILIYCSCLFCLAFLFLGFQIAEAKHGADMRAAKKKVEHCQVLITKGELYENNK